MATFTESQVRQAAVREARITKKASATILRESAATRQTSFDIFLSHSFQDADIVLGTKAEIERFGYSVYVDWVQDPQLDRSKVTARTADLLRTRMQQSRSLLYLHTENSSLSKWMPWEVGYFDAFRERVAILPVLRTAKTEFHGTEYLGLYPWVKEAAVRSSGMSALWVHRSLNVYGRLRDWLQDPEALKAH